MTGGQMSANAAAGEQARAREHSREQNREHTREHTWRPAAEGLYDPSLEKDSCGVGFIADIKGRKSHKIVSDALSILCNL